MPWFFWIAIAGIASYCIISVTKTIINGPQKGDLANIEERISRLENPDNT